MRRRQKPFICVVRSWSRLLVVAICLLARPPKWRKRRSIPKRLTRWACAYGVTTIPRDRLPRSVADWMVTASVAGEVWGWTAPGGRLWVVRATIGASFPGCEWPVLAIGWSAIAVHEIEAVTPQGNRVAAQFHARAGDGPAAVWICCRAVGREVVIEVTEREGDLIAERVYVGGRAAVERSDDQVVVRVGGEEETLPARAWAAALLRMRKTVEGHIIKGGR